MVALGGQAAPQLQLSVTRSDRPIPSLATSSSGKGHLWSVGAPKDLIEPTRSNVKYELGDAPEAISARQNPPQPKPSSWRMRAGLVSQKQGTAAAIGTRGRPAEQDPQLYGHCRVRRQLELFAPEIDPACWCACGRRTVARHVRT